MHIVEALEQLSKLVSPQLAVIFLVAAFGIYRLAGWGLQRIAKRLGARISAGFASTVSLLAALIGATCVAVAANLLGAAPIPLTTCGVLCP